MRALLSAIAAMAISAAACAQVTADLRGGIASPMGSALEYSKSMGIGYSADVMYTPQMLGGKTAFGLERDGCLMLAASGGFKDLGIGLKASRLSFTGAKARIGFRDHGPRPYAAISIGCASIKCHYICEQPQDASLLNLAPVAGCLEQCRFCIKPDLGVAFGWFTIGAGWLIPARFNDKDNGRKMWAGAFQCLVGVRFPSN